jgi:hypothetical protein
MRAAARVHSKDHLKSAILLRDLVWAAGKADARRDEH